MPPALGNARPRGRGRAGGGIPMPGGGRLPIPKRTPGSSVDPGYSPGTTAPPSGGGRGRGRVNPPGTGLLNPPGQGPAGGRPQRGVGANGKGQGATNGKGAGVSGQALPGPGGRQLQARVASGAITGEQAQRTMKQRQTLAKAFGKDFRSKLEVGGKSFADVNKQLKANPGNAKLAALRKKLLENRKAVLEAAQKKGAGGNGNGGDEGQQ